MTPSPTRTDHDRLAEFTQKIGAPPREAKFDERDHLIELNLAGLNLTSLPPEIGGFVHLQALLLGHSIIENGDSIQICNQLTSLPAQITQLVNLQRLDLRSNRFSRLPLEITDLTNLQNLGLSENHLKNLPDEISKLINLQELYLRHNRLTTFPTKITELTNLQSINLGGNSLTTLPAEITQLINLQALYLWGNHLTTLPLELGQLINLKMLHLVRNNLTVFPSSITQLPSLKTLYLDETNLTFVPPEIAQLTNLQELSLDHNKLTTLPLELVQLTNLQKLWLRGNPLRTPPPEIVSRGTEEILDFMRDLKKGSVTRYESKLIIVGEGATGKSSLLRALRGEQFVQGLSTTHGIDVKPYEFVHPEKAEERMRLNVWDFGGQHIYHTTHQFFMTQRSLYVLVWNARLDIVQANLDHWLRQIQVLAPDVPVLLVATHVENRPLDFNYARYKEAYPQLIGSVGVSNRDGTGIEALRGMIAREAAKLELMEQLWPKTWVEAEGCLRERESYYLSLADYTAACTGQGVAREIAQSALGGYLHDLGKILYFQDDDMLANFVVLKPNWLTRAISRVLDDQVVEQNKGVLAHADFPRLWDKDENGVPYERHLYPRFLRLMERFLISFRLESDVPGQPATHSLVPLRLPHTPPDMPDWATILPNQPEIQMVFHLDNFVPPGIMSWFIVLTHAYTQGLHWREGVRLAYKGHQAYVVLNASTRELRLHVRGPAPINFFNILQHTINDRILERFFVGLQYKRRVPCICHQTLGETTPCAYFHDYERLVKRMNKGRSTAECGDSFEPVSVPTLLFGIHYSTNHQFEQQLQELHDTVQQGHHKIEQGHHRIENQLTQMRIELAQGFEHLKRDFSRLWNHQMAKLNAECPNTFLIMPGDRHRFHPKNLFGEEYTLYLLCQHPPQPHMVKGEEGYAITLAEEWVANLTPWLKQLIDYLRYIPKGKGIAEAYDENFFQSMQTSLDVFDAMIQATPDVQEMHHMESLHQASSRFGIHEIEGAALRAFYRFLLQVDERQHWGGLHKTMTNDGNIFWLCDQHREEHKAM